jgi:ketosteroid isomerase-like protein
MTTEPSTGTQSTAMLSEQQRRDNNVATVHTYYRLQQEKNLDAWFQLWADDGAQSIPYAPGTFPKIVSGKPELERIYRDLFAGYGRLQILNLTIDPLLDPDRVLARWHTRAELAAGGEYNNDLIGLFEFNLDGTIRHFTEYFDPTHFGTAS